MLKTQQTYLDYLEIMQKEIATVGIDNDQIVNLKDAVETTELIIPIVGAFSAGKSTLINCFLDQDCLPVGLSPETSIAAELRHADHDFIEAVKSDDSIEEYAINEMDKIKTKAGGYKYLRIFLANKAVKDLEPVILVDMPGFDAPLDIHSRAIINYLDRGVYYIVLTSVVDGTLASTMIRHLSDIQEYGRDFSFFVSKANLRAESEVNDVVEKVESQIKDEFDLSKTVIPISNDGGKNLRNVLKALDPEELVENVFSAPLRDNFNSVLSDLNIRIAALQKDKNENEYAILQLQDKVKSITRKRDNMLEEAREKYSDTNVSRIVESVGRDLAESADGLVTTAMSGGQEALSRAVNEIIRSSLISKVKASIGEISNSIIDDFSMELQSIESTMSSFSLNDSWIEQLTDTTKNMLNQFNSKIGNMVTDRQGKDNGGMYKVITSILAITTKVIHPILELVIVFLPDILSSLFEKSQQKEQENKIRSTLLTSVIPSVKRHLRTSLPAVFEEQVNNLINQISESFNETLQAQQQSIAAMEEEKQKNMDNINEKLTGLRFVAEKITSAAKNTLY